MARSLLFGVLTFTLLGAAPQVEVNGQSILDDLYGQGVHAYFEGDYEASAQWLGQAIAQGTQDPRAYYFRGLAHLGLGDTEQANTDFAQGAEIETAGTEQFFPIANSLARVQGTPRASIERARRQARATAQEREIARQRARYEATLRAEARVLRGAGQGVAEVPAIELADDIDLPFPTEQMDPDANTDFSLLGGPALSEIDLSAELGGDTTPAPTTDPDDPFATRPPADEGADDTEPMDPSTPATPATDDGEVKAGRIFGGLLKAFGSTLPDPSKASELIPGGVPGLPPAGADPNFDPDQPETPAGDDPFGTNK